MENYDIIIIGAGIAGLTCAIYAARAKQRTLIIERNTEGGQILSAVDIENYPGFMSVSGFELIQAIKGQANKAGAETVYDNAVSFDFSDNKRIVKTLSNEYCAKAVVIASGLVHNTLGLKSEKELTGSGVSYCATCDGNFFKDKIVMVAGGGKTARFDAEYLSPIAKKVYVTGADKIGDFSEKNIEVIANSRVAELVGNPLKKVRIVGEREDVLEVDGLFIAAGRSPATQEFKNLLALDEKGYIIVDKDMATSASGVFAAGDVCSKSLRQLVTAASDGAIAAFNATKFVKSLSKI